jgi:organic radical activating enzyme
MTVTIRNLEFHVSHACNLSCEHCTHYSNFKHSGMADPEQTARHFALWKDRINPQQFALLGGEPALNPNLPSIVALARAMWPNTNLLLVTNGFFLHKHPDLPHILQFTRCALHISVHYQSPEYAARLQPVRELMDEWQKNYQFYLKYRESYSKWTETYRVSSQGLPKPFGDQNPANSWAICQSRWCPQLHEGKLWKCPQMAYLQMQLEKTGQSDDPDWKPYTAYTPLEHTCTDAELREFLLRGAESCCGMCPAHVRSFALPNPIRGKL